MEFIGPSSTHKALGQLIIDEGNLARINEHFGSRLDFGTAGLRGEMGPGPNRMNHATVRRAAYGFAKHLIAQGEETSSRGIVIGFDARHGSREFAVETAQVCGALGIASFLYEECQPTPIVAHAIKYLGAAGGVIVASLARRKIMAIRFIGAMVHKSYRPMTRRLVVTLTKLTRYLTLRWSLWTGCTNHCSIVPPSVREAF